jgi:filamentous hemagglutinin family protein
MSGRASLNHVYRTIWNQALGAMVAVAEIASSAGGRSGSATRTARVRVAVDDAAPPLRALSLSILVALMASPALAQTLPSGGVAVHGGAAFNTTQPNRLTVTTTNGAGSNHSAINWNSFSIGSGNTTNFVQPNAGSLSINRVVTNTPSQLFGALSSNGKLVLVNQSGIAVGAGAVVDTAGFTASALAMSEADAIAGRLRFGGGSSANLTVGGNIIARGGDVVLIAPNVDVAKTALVESEGGSVVLAAGQSVEVTGRGLEGITLHVQAPTDQAINLGTLKGDAVGIFAGTLRHSGMIQAVQANREGGKVVLRAVGDAYVEGQGQINATSAVGKGGSVDVLGNRVAIAGQSLIDVSGQQGGGNIRVGGDFQGKNAAVQNANMTYLGPDATLKSDAMDSGNGGRVIVWADQQTQGYGTISARGGAQSGDGGFVEVSGKANLVFESKVDTRAVHGAMGTLLLDPAFIDINTINPTATIGDVNAFAVNPGSFQEIAPGTLNAVGGNVVLQATQDITFSVPVILTTPGASLTAQAGGTIGVQAPINTTNGNITLYANAPGSGGPGSGGSAVYVNAAINSNGGIITLRSDSSDVSGNSVVIGANVNAGAGTINLIAPSDRIQQTGGSLTAASLTANADYTIDLNQPGNNISGPVTLNSNTATSSGSSLNFNNSAPAFSLISATSKGNVFITTAGSVTTFGSPIISATGNISITAPTGMSLNSNITAAGSVSLTSNTSGNITQTGGFINAGGVTTASAAFGSVDLGQISNDFSSVQVFGNGLTVRDANALNVGAFSNGTTGNILFSAGGVLTMPFGINIATTGDIALISGGAFTQQSTLSGANIALQSNGPMTLSQNITASGTLTLNDIATGGGGINQLAGSIVAAGLTTVNTSSSGNVTLNASGNDFGAISASGGSITVADVNALTINGIAATGNAVIAAPTGITLAGNVSVSGLLNLNTGSGNGNVNQTAGTITVAGATNVTAGTGNISLPVVTNDFSSISVFGGNLNVHDVNALNVTSYGLAPTGNLYFQAGGALTLPAGAVTTTGQISLITDSTLTTPGALSGSDIVLVGQTGLTIANNVTATGTLQLASTFATGSISQTAGTAVKATGATSLFTNTTTARPTNLNEPGNDFSTLAVSAFGPATIRDTNAIVLDNVTASFLTLTTGGAITQLAGSTLQTSAQTTISAGTNNVTLNNTGNQMSVLQVLNAGAVDVQNNTSAFTVFSSSAASFKALTDFDLFVSGTGITTSAGAVDLKTTGQITASAPIQAVGPVTLEAGTNLFADSLILSSAPGNAIVLTSPSTSPTDVFGSTASSGMIAPNGRWLLNLNNPANAHVFQGSFIMTPTDFIVHDALVTPVPISGNGRLFTLPAPVLSAGLSGSVTKVFDGNTSISLVGSSLSGITGYLPGDVGGTPSGGVGALDSPNVGTNLLVTASGISITGVTNANCGGCTVYGYQFGSATGNIGNVTPAIVSVSPISLSGIRAYDGTVIVNANIFSLSGLQGSDTLTLSGSGFLADKNVGTNKPVSLGSLALGNGSGLASNYTFTGGSFVATITPAPISGVVSITANSKVYDGTTVASLMMSSANLTGVFPGDVVTAAGAVGAFDDRHVGTGKNVNISGLTLAGADAGNYTFTGSANATTADITQRPSSTWTGAGGNTQWSNPANWDALPDRTNVAAVSIPAGAGSVTFDAGVDPTTLQSLTSGQTLAISGGSLSVNADLNVPGLSQAGGTLKGAGGLNVSNSFNQTGGSLQFARDVSINQATGNLVVGDLAAPRVELKALAGNITQSAGLDTPILVAESANGMALTSSANKIGSVQLTNTGTGNISLVNTGALDIAGIRNADGNVTMFNNGAINTSGLITVPKGEVNITANSPLRIGNDGIAAGGDVTLIASNSTSAGNMIIDGPITAGGAVKMAAGNNFTQNAAIFGADGVTATANGAFSYGPLALTSRAPVSYTSNGVRVAPPRDPLAARTRSDSPDAVVAFLEQFDRAQRRQILDTVETNPDGTPVKRPDRDAVTTEGNVCTR